MRLGKVLLFKGGDPIATLVKWQTRSPYSHAAILLPGTGDVVIESYPGPGVRERKLRPQDWRHIDAFNVRGFDEEDWQAVEYYLRQQMGMRYDWASVLRFVSRRPASENQRWFCSELVFAALLHGAGRRVLPRIQCCDVSPGLLRLSEHLQEVAPIGAELPYGVQRV